MKHQVGVICLLLVFGFAATVLAQDSCQVGTCLVIQRCPKLYKILTTFPRDAAGFDLLRRRNCGYEKRYPKVCCAEAEMTAETTQTAAPNNGDNRNNPNTNGNQQPTTNSPISNEVLENAKQLLPSDCGRDLSNRIVGGNVTGLDEFPWMALLEYRKPSGKTTACGGVLINKRYILTAAHCLAGASLPKNWSLTGVRLGEYNTATSQDCLPEGDDEEICADDPISVSAEEQIVHEKYSTNTQHNDVALIRLSRDVPFTNYIKPICLPSSSNINSKLIVAGWGKTETKSESEVKLKVGLPLVDRKYCGDKYKIQLHDGQFCAGSEQGKDSCRGDSGGPIMQQSRRPVDNVMRWESVGVVSFGPSPCGLPGWPGVYTNVNYYVPWILSKIRA